MILKIIPPLYKVKIQQLLTEEGSYTLSLTVTTECGLDTTETFNVLANPNVDFELDSTTFCSTSFYLVDFDQLTPTYSDGFSAPTDYTDCYWIRY